jgi:hypothetical protein
MMATLARELRRELERTVKQARRAAETGARKAVEQLGVGDGEVPRHLSPEQRGLRNRLRAHGRQLGDVRDDRRGTQATGRLIQECAYEHWHRMLFARFLAETDLLIEPQSGVAITLNEVQELAREQSRDWLELASEYAERMLPQIFRKDDPVLDIALPPETRSELEDLLKKLPRDVFLADDSLGWVYQFWQAERKDEINKSEKKIGADELPAVTQLFNEDYMVLFLLHNTLGAWWAGKVLTVQPELAASAKSEQDLRNACKVGDVEWTYLRFVRDKRPDGAEGPWRPASAKIEEWPETAKDITVLDPCMGSGHFLVFALPILVAFRMAEEGLSREAAVEAVLRDNLFGLEIDPRCTQIAAFNLAYAAWRVVGYRPLPRLNLACSGLTIGVTKAEWLKLAERAAELADPGAKRDIFGLEKNLITAGISDRTRAGLEQLYDLFAKAPWLGSLVDPRRASGDLLSADFAQLEPLLAPVFAASSNEEVTEMAVAAQGMAKAADFLSRQFTLVATNVPYLGREGHSDELASFAQSSDLDASPDLATLFLKRCGRFVGSTGTSSLVMPQNWWVGTAYRNFRKGVLHSTTWRMACVLGEEAWYTYANRGPNTILLILDFNSLANNNFSAVDVSTRPGAEVVSLEMKSLALRGVPTLSGNRDISVISHVPQHRLLSNRDYRISISDLGAASRLAVFVRSGEGSSTGDNDRFLRRHWEVGTKRNWLTYCGPGFSDDLFCDTSNVVHWEDGRGDLARSSQARIQNTELWNATGVLVGRVRGITATLFSGGCFSKGAVLICPRQSTDLPALLAFLKSPEYEQSVRSLDPRVSAATSVLTDVPFDRDQWVQIAAQRFPNGLPAPQSDDLTQSIFHGRIGECAQSLQAAVAALIAINLPTASGSTPVNAASLPSDRHVSRDGILCLAAIMGEAPAERRLNDLLFNVYGANWSAAKLEALLSEVGFAGGSLDDWLRDAFFDQHCELFQQRPFIWHVWDGRRDGFNALVNYHQLAAPGGQGRRTLEKLIYSYLGDWIDRQRADQKAGVEGADGRLAAAGHLRSELTKILEGEPPYDIFIRWRPLREQPIGWDPDINDGVRINIRPFMTARLLNGRSANACTLRTTPKIKWDKDRGKEAECEKDEYPWFWGWDEEAQDFAGAKTFDGNRWNNLHYSRAFKQGARDRKKK